MLQAAIALLGSSLPTAACVALGTCAVSRGPAEALLGAGFQRAPERSNNYGQEGRRCSLASQERAGGWAAPARQPPPTPPPALCCPSGSGDWEPALRLSSPRACCDQGTKAQRVRKDRH